MTGSLFIPSPDGSVTATEHARGPWDPNALHGGAAAALITRAFEQVAPGDEVLFGRLGFEFLKPIPLAELQVSTEIVRVGRRVQEMTAELRSGAELIGRASALRIQPVPEGLEDPEQRRERPGIEPVRAMPGPEQGKVVRFALNDPNTTSLATTGMEMSWLTDPWALGPGQVWMRMREPVVPDETATPLQRLVATADFGNGISAELRFDKHLFINADLTIHLWQAPRGGWIGLDAKTVLMDGGVGTAESVLHDERGPVGRAFQTLVVQPR
jgi:hypothetical protein